MDKPTHMLRAANRTCGPHSSMPASGQGVPDTWGNLATQKTSKSANEQINTAQPEGDRLQEKEVFKKLSLISLEILEMILKL